MLHTSNFIVRRLKSHYPHIYQEIVEGTKDFDSSTIQALFDAYCVAKGCEAGEVLKNKNGYRSLFVALVLYTIDPNAVGDKTTTGLNASIAEVLNSSRKNTDGVVCNVKGLLQFHKPFKAEVVRISKIINDAE